MYEKYTLFFSNLVGLGCVLLYGATNSKWNIFFCHFFAVHFKIQIYKINELWFPFANFSHEQQERWEKHRNV